MAMWWECIPSMGPPAPCLCVLAGFPPWWMKQVLDITAGACSTLVRACLLGHGIIWWLVKTERAMQVLHWIQRNERPFILASFYFFQHLVWWWTFKVIGKYCYLCFSSKLSVANNSRCLLDYFHLKKKVFPCIAMWWERIPSMGPPAPCLCVLVVFHRIFHHLTLDTRDLTLVIIKGEGLLVRACLFGHGVIWWLDVKLSHAGTPSDREKWTAFYTVILVTVPKTGVLIKLINFAFQRKNIPLGLTDINVSWLIFHGYIIIYIVKSSSPPPPGLMSCGFPTKGPPTPYLPIVMFSVLSISVTSSQ